MKKNFAALTFFIISCCGLRVMPVDRDRQVVSTDQHEDCMICRQEQIEPIVFLPITRQRQEEECCCTVARSYCRVCIESWLLLSEYRCPVCRNRITQLPWQMQKGMIYTLVKKIIKKRGMDFVITGMLCYSVYAQPKSCDSSLCNSLRYLIDFYMQRGFGPDSMLDDTRLGDWKAMLQAEENRVVVQLGVNFLPWVIMYIAYVYERAYLLPEEKELIKRIKYCLNEFAESAGSWSFQEAQPHPFWRRLYEEYQQLRALP